MTQSVSATISKANVTTGTFFIAADVSGTNSLNQSGVAGIWYDVNTIPIGYVNHTSWGGSDSTDCMSWQLGGANGVVNHGSVQINASGYITAQTTGSQGSGTSVPLFKSATPVSIAGPFTLSLNEFTNTSPQESGVCLAHGANGNMVPLTII